jgi:hypothetical protein
LPIIGTTPVGESTPPVEIIESTPAYFKYSEDKYLDEAKNHIAETYKKHYVGEDNVQAFDLIVSTGHGEGFCMGSIIKYGARYGKKNGYNRNDLLKLVHYAAFQLYLHDKREQKVNE